MRLAIITAAKRATAKRILAGLVMAIGVTAGSAAFAHPPQHHDHHRPHQHHAAKHHWHGHDRHRPIVRRGPPHRHYKRPHHHATRVPVVSVLGVPVIEARR